uniref:Uncharacterized protein n=1 Tax=Parascaris univalens TaxID=6257 RepID=A0A915BM75_PARUN
MPHSDIRVMHIASSSKANTVHRNVKKEAFFCHRFLPKFSDLFFFVIQVVILFHQRYFHFYFIVNIRYLTRNFTCGIK